MKLRVAACQILTGPDVNRSATKIIEWMGKAASAGVDLVVFPEAALCGYATGQEYWNSANPEEFLAAENRIVNAVGKADMAVVLGTAHWEGKALFNSLVIIDRGGKVKGRYAKTHLAEQWPQPGRKLPIYSLAGVPSCFIICHDVRYPELVRLPAMAGAQICCFCSNESGLLSEYKLNAYRAMPVSRATENGIFLIMANAPADPKDITGKSQSHGNSKIIDPDGNILVEASHFEERLVVADIDVDKADRQVAIRAREDLTILRDWIQEGQKLVEVE